MADEKVVSYEDIIKVKSISKTKIVELLGMIKAGTVSIDEVITGLKKMAKNSSNPPVIQDDVLYVWCNKAQAYIKATDGYITSGVYNGISLQARIVWSKILEDIKKHKEDALTAFTSQDYEKGAHFNAQATELEKLMDDKDYWSAANLKSEITRLDLVTKYNDRKTALADSVEAYVNKTTTKLGE